MFVWLLFAFDKGLVSCFDCELLLIDKMNIQIKAGWTPVSEYYFDFERGSVFHSRTANRAQANRVFADINGGGTLKHLSYPQACDFYKKNKTAELYLQLLRQMYFSRKAGPLLNWAEAANRPPTHTCSIINEFLTTHLTHWCIQFARTSRLGL